MSVSYHNVYPLTFLIFFRGLKNKKMSHFFVREQSKYFFLHTRRRNIDWVTTSLMDFRAAIAETNDLFNFLGWIENDNIKY